MQFFLAISVLLAVSSAYLLLQFRNRAFADDVAENAADNDTSADTLKAA